jgi:peptide/nickel transport system permease protein
LDLEEQTVQTKTRSSFRRSYTLGLILKSKVFLSGLIISGGSLFLALAANILVNPKAALTTDLENRLCWNNPIINWHLQNVFNCQGPVHLLGTDLYGRDLLQMIILSFPTDIGLSLAIVVSAAAIGVVVGSVAGFIGGKIDESILRIADVFFAFPSLLLAMIVITRFGRDITTLGFAILLVWWPLYARLIRSLVLAEKQKPYVDALYAVGASRWRVLFRHVLPNSIYPILVQATLDVGRVILAFSAIMFLGFTPSPLLPELGNLVAEGITYINIAPWVIIFPGLVIVVIAIGFNLLGDGIRDILDPRIRR